MDLLRLKTLVGNSRILAGLQNQNEAVLKFRTRFLKLPVVLILLFCFGIDSFGLQERPIRISPIQIKWNDDARIFHAYFDVTNDTPKNVDLTGIIIFKIGTFKRWRGTRLPVLKAHDRGSFKISFSPGIMLKNEYVSITVNLYGKDYVGLIDQSSRYLNISSRRIITKGKTQIELTESVPKTKSALKTKTVFKTKPGLKTESVQKPDSVPEIEKKTMIVLGPAKKRLKLLETERFQNAVLAPVSAEEKKMVADDRIIEPPPPKPPPAPENLSITPEKYQNRITWKPVDKSTEYHLYWGRSAGVTPENGKKIENIKTGYVHTGLHDDVSIYYVLIAEKDGLESEPSKEVVGKPIVPPRDVPQLTVKSGDRRLQLSWTTVESATKYYLYWGATETFEPSDERRAIRQGNTYEHSGLDNDQTYYYVITAVNPNGEGELSPVISGTPKRLEASVTELLEGVQLDEFAAIKTDPNLLVSISDVNLEKQAGLKRAEELKELDISSRDKLISLYIAEGKSESVAKVLSGQLSKEPENLNLSLSLSKVYHEQGDITAALKVLNSSLNRISLSARIALNQELKTSVRKGESTLTTKSEEAYLADEFSRLGISLLEKKKYVEALSAFQSLYSLSQDYPMVKYYLGLSRHGLKQYNLAKQLFVEQAEADLQKKQLMDDLAALTLVLATTLEIPTIKDTRSRYVTIQKGENTPAEAQTLIVQIATLDALLEEAKKRRLAGLPDLGIVMSNDFSRSERQPGQKIRFAFVITNHGKKQSEPFRVYYQLKHDQGLTFDIPAFDRFQPIRAEMAKYSWEKEILIPDSVVPGKYQLIANVEQTGGKGEVSFENNLVQSVPEISVIQPVPDLEKRKLAVYGLIFISVFSDDADVRSSAQSRLTTILNDRSENLELRQEVIDAKKDLVLGRTYYEEKDPSLFTNKMDVEWVYPDEDEREDALMYLVDHFEDLERGLQQHMISAFSQILGNQPVCIEKDDDGCEESDDEIQDEWKEHLGKRINYWAQNTCDWEKDRISAVVKDSLKKLIKDYPGLISEDQPVCTSFHPVSGDYSVLEMRSIKIPDNYIQFGMDLTNALSNGLHASNLEFGFGNGRTLGVVFGINIDEKWMEPLREKYFSIQYRVKNSNTVIGATRTIRTPDFILVDSDVDDIDGTVDGESMHVYRTDENEIFIASAIKLKSIASHLHLYLGPINQKIGLQYFIRQPDISFIAEASSRSEMKVNDRETDTVANEDRIERKSQANDMRNDILLGAKWNHISLLKSLFVGRQVIFNFKAYHSFKRGKTYFVITSPF